MKKFLILNLILLVLIGSLFLLSSCGNGDKEVIVRVKSVDSYFEVNAESGEKELVTIITYYDGKVETFKNQIPKEIASLEIKENTFIQINEDDSKHIITIVATFVDGTKEEIPIEDHMIISEQKVDFTKVGAYGIQIKYHEKTIDATINVIAPVNIMLEKTNFNQLADGETAPEIKMTVEYSDGSSKIVVLKSEMITSCRINWTEIGEYPITIEYDNKSFTKTICIIGENGKKVIRNGSVECFESAAEMLTSGGEIKLISDINIALSSDLVFDKETILDLNGKILTVGGGCFRIHNNVKVKNGTIINVDDYGFLVGKLPNGGVDGITGKLTIESGEFHTHTTVAQATYGEIIVTGGTFSVDPYEGSYAYLFNCYDSSYTADPKLANIIISGGTFYNWNPGNNAAELGGNTNFLKNGYLSTKADTEDIWTVTG